MKFDLVRPCEHCPFRSDVTPYLRPGRVEQIANHLERGTFPCHETTGEKGGRKWPRSHQQHCAGALLSQVRSGVAGDMLQLAIRLKMLDGSRLDMAAPVNDLRAFVAHHGGDPDKINWQVGGNLAGVTIPEK